MKKQIKDVYNNTCLDEIKNAGFSPSTNLDDLSTEQKKQIKRISVAVIKSILGGKIKY